jgi:hypothetical protein
MRKAKATEPEIQNDSVKESIALDGGERTLIYLYRQVRADARRLVGALLWDAYLQTAGAPVADERQVMEETRTGRLGISSLRSFKDDALVRSFVRLQPDELAVINGYRGFLQRVIRAQSPTGGVQ